MNHTTTIHWDELEEKLHLDLSLNKSGMVKADMYDSSGNCIVHVIDKIYKAGEHKINKHIKDISNGIYFLKIVSADYGCHVIRFSVN